MRVAVAHDYLTQRGGAERVVLSTMKAFPGAPLYTSLYEPALTYPEFGEIDVRTSPLNSVRALRDSHRLALPLLAPAFSAIHVDADVVVCSSSGWAHGIVTRGRKIVYCHSPARWLYQRDRYVATMGTVARLGLAVLASPLSRWDRAAAASAGRYLANSVHTAAAISSAYGIEAEVVPPPPALEPMGFARRVDGLAPGFFLVVSRLLAYKNVDRVVEAFADMPDERLAIVGLGPEERRLRALATSNVRLLGSVSDAELRWLYARCAGVVAAGYEDFGLVPLEAATFGKPVAALRWGGFLDTMRDGLTGVFFDRPTARDICRAVVHIANREWQPDVLQTHAARYCEARFIDRLRGVVFEESRRVTPAPATLDEPVWA
jgi:glycosyltransferase involved in cell wall biosynthesis